MDSETLEKLKIEIRSILLSSKHGVEAECIQSDYEKLMYQRLPLKELGFRDVQSLMRAIPDVAEEVRSHTGEITYHAVCDESTAHIQKLVSNQVTKKSKSKFSTRGRGRRHGVVSRGAYFGRGSWSPDKRGSLGGGTKHRTSRPRALQIIERESENRILASGDSDDYKREYWGRVNSNEHVDVSATNALHFPKTSRAIVGRGDLESSNSYSDVGTDWHKQRTPVYNLKIGISESGKREISKLIQPMWNNRGGDEGEPTSQFDLRDFLNRKRAATTLVRDHGEPVSNTVGRHVKTTHVSLDSTINKKMVKENRAYQKFLPPRLQRLQQQNSGEQEKPAVRPVEEISDLQLYFNDENTVYSTDGGNWVPPKDGQLYVEAFNNYFAQRGKDAPKVEIVSGKLNKKKGFYGRLSYQDKYYYPLEIMQTEELAHQNVVRAFCQKNDISLLHNGQIEVNITHSSSSMKPTELNTSQASSSTRQAEVNSNNSSLGMKPTEVNTSQASSSTRQAEVNSNNSSSSMKPTEVNTSQASSSTRQAEVSSNNSSSSMKPTEVNTSQASSSTRQAEVSSNNSSSSMKETEVITTHSSSSTSPTVSQQKLSDLPETLQKVYKILKPNGIWLSNLPNLYEQAYKETLNLDFLSISSQWPQYFTLEKLAGNRYTVYPVANYIPEKTEKITAQAAEKITAQATEKITAQATEKIAKTSEKITAQATEKIAKATEKITAKATEKIAQATEKITARVQVPPSLQPAVGSKVQMFLSFAYSPEDVYLQRADMENLVYDIDDALNNNCPASSPPAVDTIVLKSLVAASYENRWYRAQVVAVQKLTVKVYFIDYGNQEEVSFADLRPIPQELLILNTPSLAIKCALRKTKAGEWLKNVFSILSDLSEANSVLSAEIVEHKGEQCIVDLRTLEGGLVNDMLLQSVSSPTTRVEAVPSVTNSPEPGAQQLGRSLSLSAAAPRLFADDPEPLVLPDSDEFVVYVCRVMSENTVLLRIVDDEYSEKLDELEQAIADNFYSWPIPEKIRQSNIYACMVLAGAEDAEDVEYDEEGKEKISDQNNYHRVRVLKEHKDGVCDCYLPDHGHNETLNRSQLREIDSQLNVALSYQAFMVRLHGLDSLPDKLKPMAVRLLIRLLTNGATFYAVKKGKSAEKRKDDPGGVGVCITDRVRKIISCLKDIQPSAVAKVYEQVYHEPVENVEEIIKNIPGYGYWKESLEVDLVDTSQEDSDVNINEYVLAAIEEMDKVESGGGSVEDVWRDLFCSDTDSGSQQGELDNWEANERLQDDKNLVDAGVSKVETDTQPDPVRESVHDLSTEAEDSVTPTSGKSLYTWKTKPSSPGGVASSSPTPTTSQGALPANPACDNSQLPKFWHYPLLKFVSLQIVRVENPSDFVAIPVEQRGALGKLEMAIAQYFSANKAEAAVTCSDNVLYAVKSKDVFRRALYVSLIGDMVKVFFPDHYSYDVVPPSELLPLPIQFNSLPFLARKMRLGGVLPQGQDWPAYVSQWFKTTVGNKSLYALVTGQDSNMNQSIPRTLVVRLIDTSGSEDLVVDEYMVSQEMALSEPNND